MYLNLFFNKVAGLRPATLLKKETLVKVFSCEFTKFLRTLFVAEHLRWLLLKELFLQFLKGDLKELHIRIPHGFVRIIMKINLSNSFKINFKILQQGPDLWKKVLKKLTSHYILHHLCSADLSKSFLQLIVSMEIQSVFIFSRHFFKIFCPVEKCGVTSHSLCSLTLKVH